MIVVVIVAILAAVVVPNFFRESKKVTGKSEVVAMFAELGTKQDRQKSEKGSYLAVATCPTGALSASKQSISACQSAADWLALGIMSPENELRCAYTVVVGDAGDDPTMAFQPDGVAGASIPTTAPGVGWYVLQAKCNMDSSGSTYSYYLSSSLDQKLQTLNEGH